MQQQERRHYHHTNNILTLEQRVQVIREFERTPEFQSLSYMFKCSTNQIRSIIHDKETILYMYQKAQASSKRPKVKSQPKPLKHNRLSLEDRVHVIRAFQRTPNYKSIAANYECSAKQIKSIIQNKEIVLSSYRLCQQKIAFLDKVIFEFIARTLSHNAELTEDIVCQKAMEVKKILGIKEGVLYLFLWLQNFKKNYKISSFDVDDLKMVISPQRKSLEITDLIHDISKEELKLEQQINNVNSTDYQEFLEKISKSKVNREDWVTVFLECGEGNESNQTDIEIQDASLLKLPEVDCYQEALHHLKVLEEFALLRENYRAIGLIAQLEQVLKNTPNNE